MLTGFLYGACMNFGTLLAHHRGRRSQASVAHALGITPRTLSAIEADGLTTARTLAKLLYRYETDGEGPRFSDAQKVELFDALVAMGVSNA